MQKRILIFIVTCLLFLGQGIHAQDAHFSQFYANPLYLNPAFAGTNICPRIALNFRDQWPSMKGTFMSFSASYDQHFDKIAGGIGVLAFGDRCGQDATIQSYEIGAMYSFKVKVSKKFNMRFALQFSYLTYILNTKNLTFGDMIDPKYGFIYQTSENLDAWKNTTDHSFDFTAGFMGYTQHFYFGYAAHHLNRPQISFIQEERYRLPIKHTVHVGASFDVKRKSKKEHNFGDLSLSPNVIFQYQGGLMYMSEGLYVNLYPVTLGAWLRHSFKNVDAIIFSAGVEYEFIRVGYSYDLTISKLINLTGGAHEVSLQFLLPCPEKRKPIKDLDCPSF
ncbi:MAG: type IX secretion system membrane protein PorP/SprF [Bacteroidales bacterium]|nr:type IX secretion system membrane protein PorP/SprF [Bacteroidales bacterium]